MKLNNLAVHAKHTALFAFIAMMTNACTSQQERLNEMDKEIENLEAQIDSTHFHNEATDSVARNPMLRSLKVVLDRDEPRIDSLRDRNNLLADSIRQQDEIKAGRPYPLSMFLSKNDLKCLQDQLRNFHYSWNNKHANNIIAGRGTLQDLYRVSFDLDYYAFEPPFHIINELGYVRFNDERLNNYCRQFEKQLAIIDRADVKIKHQANKAEFDKNEQEISAFERLCEINDSIYIRIAAHFAPQINHRIDSLKAKREELITKRDKLIMQMQQRNK